jgi:CDP-diglyceride synthetase
VVVLSVGGLLWSFAVLVWVVTYFGVLIWILANMFRRQDTSTRKKAMWLILLLGLPLIAMAAYFLMDVVRRHDLSRGRKALWALMLLVVATPITSLVYIIKNGEGMAARNIEVKSRPPVAAVSDDDADATT